MNKKVLLINGGLLTLIIIISTIFIINKNNANNEIVMQDDNKNLINNSFLTLMLEQEDGTYLESTSNTWPSGNYAFNESLSRCENGGELRWNREEGIVNLLSNKSDACYVYFDLYNVVTITNVSASKTTNSVTLTVTVDAGENPVATYYFSMDGGRSYQTSNTSSYTFSNLTDNTKYTFQVYAVDTEGYESNEETIEVTTDAYVNPVVNSVTATNVENDSITVSVSASVGTNVIQTYYYSIDNGAYTSSSSNTYTFSGLSAGTNYSIRVYVKDTNGVDSNIYTINAETENGILLADYIKGLYTSQGSNGLYYHTSSLANSAGDNSYRYAGANPNNYVCFGSTASTCPSDNLYRIIGVFGNQVKLIKADYPTISQVGNGGTYVMTYESRNMGDSYYKGQQSLSSIGSYQWNSSSSNIWSNSILNIINLNSVYLSGLGSIWSNKIANATWYVDGYSSSGVTPAIWKDAESKGTTWNGKIGLMYVSDYGYAASNSAWTSTVRNYSSSSIKNSNWMYMGLSEWTISRDLQGYTAYMVYDSGYLYGNYNVNGDGYAIRPVFYLNSNVTYVSGSGTSSDPIRLS